MKFLHYVFSLYSFCSSYCVTAKAQQDVLLLRGVERVAGALAQGSSRTEMVRELGPESMEIAIQKLTDNLNRGFSPGSIQSGDGPVRPLPPEDLLTARNQIGYILFLKEGVKYFEIEGKVRDRAIQQIVSALESPNISTRYTAAETLGEIVGTHAVEAIFPLLDDPSEAVRVRVTLTLAKIGDEGTALRLDEVLRRRKAGKLEVNIERDYSFKLGDEVVKTLRGIKRESNWPNSSVPLGPHEKQNQH